MSEFEEAAETAHEIIKEELTGEAPPWVGWVAVSTLMMALFSAIGALLAGITANEAIIERTSEIIETQNRDRDQVRREVIEAKHAILKSLNQPIEDDEARLLENRRETQALTRETAKDEIVVRDRLESHEIFAIGVTLLSIAITLSGLAIVTTRRRIWHVGIVFGAAGGGAVLWGIAGRLFA